jgi:hypothetical protein
MIRSERGLYLLLRCFNFLVTHWRFPRCQYWDIRVRTPAWPLPVWKSIWTKLLCWEPTCTLCVHPFCSQLAPLSAWRCEFVSILLLRLHCPYRNKQYVVDNLRHSAMSVRRFAAGTCTSQLPLECIGRVCYLCLRARNTFVMPLWSFSRKRNPEYHTSFFVSFRNQLRSLLAHENLLQLCNWHIQKTIWIWLSFSSGTSENRTAMGVDLNCSRPPLHWWKSHIYHACRLASFAVPSIKQCFVRVRSVCHLIYRDMSMYLAPTWGKLITNQ